MKTPSKNRLVLTPHCRISLWDMIEFSSKDFAVLQRLKTTLHTLRVLQEENPAGILDDKKRHQLAGILSDVKLLWAKIDLIGELEMIQDVSDRLNNIPNINYSEVAESVRVIISKTSNELELRSFAYIPFDKTQFFEQSELFGKAVKEASSEETNSEIKAAGNCLAAELNTAAIFHLMRVAEFGMRALARRLRVKVKRNTIDSAGWTEIINNIGGATAVRWKKLPKAKKARRKATDFLKFCEVAADELNVFKEIWRNNVMHASGNYKESEALYVFERVKDFMQRLAKQVPLK